MEDRTRQSLSQIPVPPRSVKLSSLDDTVAIGAPAHQRPRVESPHRVERDVQRHLLAQPDVHFRSLVVRRFQDAVCLEGVVEVENALPDMESLVRQVAGVNRVLNRLLVKKPDARS